MGLLPLLVLLGVWQVTASNTSLSFPPPSKWLAALRSMHEQAVLLPAIGVTIATFASSLLLALLLGIVLGIVVGGSVPGRRALTPTLEFIRAVPPPALVPVVAVILGTSMVAGVAIVVIAIVWPILLSTAAGMRGLPPVRQDMARSVGLTRAERIRKVTLPSLVPAIFTGTRIAVSVSLVVTLLADILGSGHGVGQLISERQQSYDAASVWGLLLVIGLFGCVLNALLDVAGRLLDRGRPTT
ncbi:MAG TPA: ABC transporter permease subunit [Amycolatopsis sp.]|uniref:ABC transporter permease n=1 Tax=Amycolatopsis sp. TaxID=37632 RepID=UPI002B49FC9B|nr:ABC transporter permease subunit [Amycolatopsis sp.]HKS50217.1 ABC transporter permease subunit [Amycolatopsis sp.]